MKTAENMGAVTQMEIVSSTAFEETAAPRKVKSGIMSSARIRHVMIVVVALLSAWVAYTVISSTRDLETELEQTYDSMRWSPHQ